MQSLDPPVENFRRARVRRDVRHGNPPVEERLGGAARGENFGAERGKPLRHIDDPRLIRDTDQCPLHAGHATTPCIGLELMVGGLEGWAEDSKGGRQLQLGDPRSGQTQGWLASVDLWYRSVQVILAIGW